MVPLEENVQPAFESGNPRFSLSSQDIGVQNSLFVGYKLDQVHTRYLEALHHLASVNLPDYSYRLTVWFQAVLKLTGEFSRGTG